MPLNAICLVPGLARLNLEQHLPALAAMDGSSQGKCDSDNNSDNNSSNSRCKRDVGSETPIIRPNLEGEFTGWDASPCCYTLLFFFGRLLPAAPIPIPTSSKREPSNRRKLLPSWRGLMSYRGDGLGPGQRATHSSAGAAPHAPPSPSAAKQRLQVRQAAYATDILEIPECQKCAIWAVTRPLPPEPVPTQLHPEW